MNARCSNWMLAGFFCVGVAGCRHSVPPAPVIPPPTPVAVASAPVPQNSPQLPTVPTQSAPLAEVPVVPAKPEKKAKKKVPATSTAAPVQMASIAAPAPPGGAPSALGSLTAEGDASAESRRNATELLVANEKRLGALSSSVRDQQKKHLLRVQNFQQDAQKALNAGDAEGAFTLATKAKVLLDELTK